MQIYIESVIIDNLIIDYLLLKYSFLILKKKKPFRWLFFCSFLGTAFAVVLPLFNLQTVYAIIIRIVFCFLYVLVSSRCKNVKEYFSFFAVFMGLTFLCGGVIIGLYYTFSSNIDENYTLKGISIGIIIFAVYILVKAIYYSYKKLYKQRKLQNFECDCIVVSGNKEITLKGFIDSGNMVYDKENNPVAFVNNKVAYKIIDVKSKISKLSVNSVSGSIELLVFSVENFYVLQGNERKQHKELSFAICDKRLIKNNYDIILPILV